VTYVAVAIIRVIGLIWAIGSVSIIRNARSANDEDARRWIIVGGVLTFVAGLLMLVASRWAVVPVLLLVAQQGVFHLRQAKRLPEGAARPNPAHVIIAAMVAAVVVLLALNGALR